MKIDQDAVTRAFMVRNGTSGCYWNLDTIQKIQEVLQRDLGVHVSQSEAIDFWRWRSSEWDSSFLSLGGEQEIQDRFQKFIQFVGVEPPEDQEDLSEPSPRPTVKVVVKDSEGEPWEVELEARYHEELLREIEAQIPEKSTGGTIRYSLEYDPSKVLSCRKLEEKET